MSAASTLNSIFRAWSGGLTSRSSRNSSIDLSRLNPHDLADLNLPPEVRTHIELRRGPAGWDRFGSWRGI